jgi:hypothetical protein
VRGLEPVHEAAEVVQRVGGARGPLALAYPAVQEGATS